MATIYNLVTQLTADPAPMKAGFDRGLALVNSFAANAQRALTKQPRNALGQFTKFGADAALSTLDGLRSTFESNEGKLKEALFRGALNPRQFEAQSRANGLAFNRVLLNTISQIDIKKSVPPGARQQLVDALKLDALDIDPFKKVGERFRSLGRDATQLGLELSFAITAPLAGGAAAAIKAADIFEHALNSIQNSTGATGSDLAALNSSLHKLFADLPNSADDIAKALTVISQVSGATGGDLEALATQALNLSRITGTDLNVVVTASQHAFEAWGVSIANQQGNLDLLFRVSQRTGATVGDLSQSLAHFSPALQQLGLSFGQSAALIGQFQKSGIDADSVLTTLQTSLSKFAEHGVDGAHALQLLVDSIKNAGSDAEAINLAARIFGPRQAAQLAGAVRSGKLDIQALTDSVRAASQTINAAAASTDTFGTRMTLLKHASAEASSAIGESLQRSFTALLPLLTTIIGGIGAVANVFTSLPTGVQLTVTAILALAAGIGPVIFLLGGLARGIGAVSLAFGILREAKAASAVVDIATGAVSATGALSSAAGAAGTFARGLQLLKGFGPVVIVLGLIAGAIGAMTRESREAKTKLQELTETLRGMSQQQLTIKTNQLQQELDARLHQVDALEARITEIRAHSQLNDPGVADSVSNIRKQQSDLLHGNEFISDSLKTVTKAFGDVETSTAAAAKQAADFQDTIAATIVAANKGLKVDDHGKITGPINAMRAAVAKLRDDLASRIPVKGLNVDAAQSAIEHLQTQIDKFDLKGAPGIAEIFPQLSAGVANLDRFITATVGHAQSLGGTLQQLGDAKLSGVLLSQYRDLSAVVKGLGDRTDLDAQKFRELKKALEGTAAVQIAGNASQSSTFTVDVDARIRRIVPDGSASAGREFVATVKTGLDNISAIAQRAALAQMTLVRAEAGGSSAQIVDAQREVERATQDVIDAEESYRRVILRTNASLEDQRAALAEIAKIESETGFDAAKAALSQTNILDAKAIGQDLQKTLEELPPARLGVQLFVDTLTIDEVARRTQTELTKAQIQALAGSDSLASVTRTKAIDDLGRQFQALAATMDIRNPSQADIAEFQRIALAAAKLGISLDDVARRMRDLTKFGKADRLASALAAASAAALGADSSITKMISSLSQGVSAAHDLSDAIKSIKAGGGFDAILGGIGAVGGIISSIKGIGSAIGGLLGIGGSALDKEHDQILNANNAALKQLTLSLDRQAGTANRAAQLAVAAQSAIVRPFSRVDEAQFPELRRDAAGFAAELQKYNLTIDQAEAAAKALGITLFDSKHHLVGLNDFADALAREAKIITTLGQDLSTQQKLIAVKNAISGAQSSPASVLQDQIEAIAKVAPSIGATLQEASAHGSAAIRAALASLVQRIQDGTISLTELGGFQNVGDLLDALGTTADDVNALGNAAKDASAAMLNVPAGFKQALAEFNAQAPQAPKTAPSAPAPTPTPITPKPPAPLPQHDPTGPLLEIVKQLDSLLGKSSNAPAAIGGPAAPLPIPGVSVALELTHPEDIKPLAIDASLIAFTAADPVHVPAPLITVAPFDPIEIAAPTFHVKQLEAIEIAAPPVAVLPFAPQSLAAPLLTITGDLAPIVLDPPVVSVLPFPAIVLAAPQITLSAPAPVALPAPMVTFAEPLPILLAAPAFVLQQSTQTLTLEPPTVTVAGDLASVVLQPPPVAIEPYTGSVALLPPAVSIGPLADIHAPAPAISIAAIAPVALAAPAVAVAPLADVSLARPEVHVLPLAEIALDPPKITVQPFADLTLKAPTELRAPSLKMPALLPSDGVPSVSDSQIARALALLAANQPAGSSDIHIHDPVFQFTGDVKTARQLFDDVKRQAQKIAHQKTGDSTRVVDALAN